MSDNKEYYHDKAEKDVAEEKGYNPPHGIVDSLTTWSRSEMERHGEENEAYDKGWDNAQKQKS